MKRLIFCLLLISSTLNLTWARPSDCDSARALIKEALELKEHKQRRAHLEKAISLCPEADVPYFQFAMELEREENKKKKPNYEEAEQAYREVLRIKPEHAGALFQLGGIEYVNKNFDTSMNLYTTFLNLDTKQSHKEEMVYSARKMVVKNGWLAQLPADDIKRSVLIEDPDRKVGIGILLGEVAYELGIAATQVTGLLGYEAAGTGLLIATALLSTPKNHNGKIARWLYNKNYERVYTYSQANLTRAINKYGIESDEVQTLLQGYFIGAWHAGVSPTELSPFARAYMVGFSIPSAILKQDMQQRADSYKNTIFSFNETCVEHPTDKFDLFAKGAAMNYVSFLSNPDQRKTLVPESDKEKVDEFNLNVKLKGDKTMMGWRGSRSYLVHALETLGHALADIHPQTAHYYYTQAIEESGRMNECVPFDMGNPTQWRMNRVINIYNLAQLNVDSPESSAKTLHLLIEGYEEVKDGRGFEKPLAEPIARSIASWAETASPDVTAQPDVQTAFRSLVDSFPATDELSDNEKTIKKGWATFLQKSGQIAESQAVMESIQ